MKYLPLLSENQIIESLRMADQSMTKVNYSMKQQDVYTFNMSSQTPTAPGPYAVSSGGLSAKQCIQPYRKTTGRVSKKMRAFFIAHGQVPQVAVVVKPPQQRAASTSSVERPQVVVLVEKARKQAALRFIQRCSPGELARALYKKRLSSQSRHLFATKTPAK